MGSYLSWNCSPVGSGTHGLTQGRSINTDVSWHCTNLGKHNCCRFSRLISRFAADDTVVTQIKASLPVYIPVCNKFTSSLISGFGWLLLPGMIAQEAKTLGGNPAFSLSLSCLTPKSSSHTASSCAGARSFRDYSFERNVSLRRFVTRKQLTSQGCFPLHIRF